jgi:flagellar basal body-associated protein FliL
MADEGKKGREEKLVKEEEETRQEAQQGNEGAAAGDKERSSTALDTEGLDREEISPEDDTGEEEAKKQEEGSQKKGIGKREYLAIGISLLLVLIVMSSSVFIWARYFASDDEKVLTPSVPQGPVYELKPFFVPFKSNSKSKGFVRLNLTLELYERSSEKKIKKRIEEVRSRVFRILVNTSSKNIENNQGKRILSEEIVSTINLVLAEKVVKKVYIRDVVLI